MTNRAEKPVADSALLMAFPYLQEFSCIGPECSDSCCKGWDIRLDNKGFTRLKQAMDVSPEERQRFMKSVSLNTDTRHKDVFANFRRDTHGVCAFLDHDRLCHLQKNYGQEMLTPTCIFYPRVFSQLDGAIEITGALSCPEMARVCLLAPKLPELAEVSDNILPGTGIGSLNRVLNSETASPYTGAFPRIRMAIKHILAREEDPLMFRLFLLCNLAGRIGEELYHEAEPYDTDWLEGLISHSMDEENIAEIRLQFEELPEEEPLTMMLVFAFLKGRLDQGGEQRLVQIGNDIMEHYQECIGKTMNSEDFSRDLWIRFSQFQQENIPRSYLNRVDEILTRYCMNQVYREWYVGYPDLLSYVHMLIVRIAIQKFLYLSHPWIRKRLETGDSLDIQLLESVAVDVTYSFSRAIDHNLDYLKAIYESMEQEGLFTIEYSPVLTSF